MLVNQEGLFCRNSNGDENGSSPHAADAQRREAEPMPTGRFEDCVEQVPAFGRARLPAVPPQRGGHNCCRFAQHDVPDEH